jgi:hypothetical protein
MKLHIAPMALCAIVLLQVDSGAAEEPQPTLFAWLSTRPLHLDGHGHAIPRPTGAALTISNACEGDVVLGATPKVCAAHLDVLASHESAYHTGVTGDGGKSCGAWQTPCSRTPPDGQGQARLALRLLKQANDHCEGHPLWLYASGRCERTRTAAWYEAEVKAMLEP